MKEFKLLEIIMPTEEELIRASERWWNEQKDTTFLAWNDRLLSMSYDLEIIPIPTDLVLRMLKITDSKEDHKAFPEVASELQALMENAVESFGTPFFVKLISRSPKDFLYNDEDCGKPKGCSSAAEVLNALLISERTFDDLVYFAYIDKCALVIRPYVKFNPLDEWRVLVEDGKIRGISQYYYTEPWDNHVDLVWLESKIRPFIELVISEMPVKSFIADLIVYEGCEPVLLETNPWGLSDPCLFVSYDKLDGTLKVNI